MLTELSMAIRSSFKVCFCIINGTEAEPTVSRRGDHKAAPGVAVAAAGSSKGRAPCEARRRKGHPWFVEMAPLPSHPTRTGSLLRKCPDARHGYGRVAKSTSLATAGCPAQPRRQLPHVPGKVTPLCVSFPTCEMGTVFTSKLASRIK